MPTLGNAASIARDIESWIRDSTTRFHRTYVNSSDDKIWVLKFFPPKYLEAFFSGGRRLRISKNPGFTWGDGVYVTPIKHAYSSMIYGRAGVMGWIEPKAILKVYDAGHPSRKGIQLYQDWIMLKTSLFDELTTTIHSEIVNQQLRNEFRFNFKIDLVIFPPDESNNKYTQSQVDRWFTVSEFLPTSPPTSPQTLSLSKLVEDCLWVLMVKEEFVSEEKDPRKRLNLFGQYLGSPNASQRPDPTTDLIKRYKKIKNTVGNPNFHPVLEVDL